jgi:hypothetical protein
MAWKSQKKSVSRIELSIVPNAIDKSSKIRSEKRPLDSFSGTQVIGNLCCGQGERIITLDQERTGGLLCLGVEGFRKT